MEQNSDKIRLLIPLDPWRLLINLDLIQQESNQILTVLTNDQRSDDIPISEVSAHLFQGSTYRLQQDESEKPLLDAELVRKQQTAIGLELVFQI